MEETSVIRQETFDVDPALTLRSRSGGVKRGSIALPIIGTDTYASTPPIKEASFESVEGESNSKPKTKVKRGKNVLNARPSTYILNAEVRDQQKHVSSKELKGGNPKQSSIKGESQKTESKNSENVKNISDNKSEQTNHNPKKEKVHKLDKNRYEDVDSLDKTTKKDSDKNKENELNKPTVTSNRGAKSDTNSQSVDSENKDKNQAELSTSKKENKNSKHPNKGSKESVSKKENIEKSQKDDKANKSTKAEEKSGKKFPEQQIKPSQPKRVEVNDKAPVQNSVKESNNTAPRGNKSVPPKHSTNSTDNKNKDKSGSSVDPKDNHTSNKKTLPVSSNLEGKSSVAKSKKDSSHDKVGHTDNKNEEENSTDRPVKTKNPASKDDVQKAQINQIKQKDDRSARHSTNVEKGNIKTNSSQDSQTKLPNRSTTSNRVVENHAVINNSDKNKRPPKEDVSSRKDAGFEENPSPRQVKFSADVSNNEDDTFSVDLSNFEGHDYTSYPPKSTTLAEKQTQNVVKTTENSIKKETISANNGNATIESDISRTNGNVITSKGPSQDNKVSVSKTEKRDNSNSQKYLRPSASDKESYHTGKVSPNSVYRGRSPKPVDSISINRYSVSPDKHYHGNSRVYSPEKPYYDEKRSRRSVMESPTRQPEASESYEAVYAERKTLLDAEVTYKKRIKQLEDELNQFLRTIDDLRAENKILRSKIDDLERSTTSQEESVSHQSKNTVVIDTEKIGLEEKIKDLMRENKELNQRLEESGTKVNLALSENKQLSDKYEEVFWKNKELEEKCSELENRLRNMKEKSSEENDDTGNLDKVENENALLKRDLEKLSIDIEKANTESKSAFEENEKLKKELEDNKDIKDQLENKQKELDASQKDEARAKSQFEKLKLEFEQMKLDGDEAKNKEIEKLKAEVVNLKMELKRMEAEKEKYKELTTPRPDDSDEKRSPNTETMTLKSQVISLQSENQNLNEEIIKMKAEHLETVKKMHDLEKTAKSFEKSVTDVESEKISQIQDLENENSRLKAENKSLNESLNQKKSEIQELMSAMKDDKFEDEIKQAKEDKEQSRKELEGKSNELDTMKKEMEEFKMKYDTLEKEKKKEEEQVLAMSKLNDDKKKEINDLKAKVDGLNKDLEREKEKSTSLQESEKDIADAKSQVSKLEKDIENMKIKHEKEVKHLRNVNDQENEEWRKKYISLEKENKEEILHLKEEIERLKAEIAKLEGLRESAKDLEDTRKDLVVLQGRVSDLTIELEQRTQVDERNFELSLKIETLNKRIRELETENKNLSVDKDIAGDFETSNKKLSQENKKLRFQLDEKSVDQKMEILERKQKDNETRVRQLEGWVGDLYEENPDTKPTKKRQKKQPFSKAGPTIADKKSNNKPRSLDEVNVKVEEDKVTTHSSTPSLPNIFENEKKPLTFGLGYSQIYRNRIKTVSKYKKS